jgi:MFS family permease
MLVNRLASFVGPFLALYLVRQHGYGPEAAGRVVALFGLGVLLSGPLGGALTDRVGRRATMLVGLGLGGACVAGLAFATAPAAIAALSLSASLFGETYRPAAMTVVADVVPVEDRARAYGLVYWAVNLGWAVSLSVAGFIAERSFFALFLADAATSIAFAVLVLRRIPETRPANLPREPLIEGFATTLRDRAFVTFLGLHLAGLLVFSQFQLAAPLDMGRAGIGPAGFSALMALNGVGVVLLQPVVTHRLGGRGPLTTA